ncbi:hypothetical protein BGW38_008178 [Lunasporangiospora selenospora]|uniref:Uncharacterized protein n=1 Tax=Lunasporangiospora selenospora TaxID=979761 RepID=A0A9P6FJS5_9FUNG|nr:hypothetical protein BGW38_008178 [Lunasporangiospora selenospora]
MQQPPVSLTSQPMQSVGQQMPVQSRPFQPQAFVNRSMSEHQGGQIPMTTPMTALPVHQQQQLQIPITQAQPSVHLQAQGQLQPPQQQQPPQALSQTASPVISHQNIMNGSQSPMSSESLLMTSAPQLLATTVTTSTASNVMTTLATTTAAIATSIPLTTIATEPPSLEVVTSMSMTDPTSPVLSPTNGIIKKPKNLRVHIPNETKEGAALGDTMIKTEDSNQLPPIQKRPLESAPISSTLPSHFAKNLPSPSTFYPEFYASQTELSPIVFGQTPTSAQPSSAFNWPLPRERELARVHQPSPLAKGQIAASSIGGSSSGTSNIDSKGMLQPGSGLRMSTTASIDSSSVANGRPRTLGGEGNELEGHLAKRLKV